MRTTLFLAAALSAAGLASAAPLTANTVSGCVTNYDASTDYFPEKVTASATDGWTIEYHNSHKILTNVGANESYVLYQCGTPAPNVTGVSKAFAVPITKAAIADTTAVTYFELLGKLSAIDYVDADTIGLVVSPCFQKEIADKSVSALATNATQKEQEIASMDMTTDFMANDVKNSIVWSASLGDNVARRNYIKYLSVFFNQEAQANTIDKSLSDNYACVSSAAVAQAKATKAPIVAFVEYQAPSDFNNQTAAWQINLPKYKAEYISDAGAVAPVNKTTKYTNVNDFLAAVKDVEYLIDETFIGTTVYSDFLTTYGLTNTSSQPFIKNKKVYRTDRLQNDQGWTAWFESAVLLNNIVLADITSELYPTIYTSYARTYLRNIATEPASTAKITVASQCTTGQATTVTCPAAAPTTTKPSAANKLGVSALAVVVAAAGLVL